MHCVQGLIDAGPAGKIRCWQVYIYNAESPKQSSKSFNSIMKTIQYFASLGVILLNAEICDCAGQVSEAAPVS